MIRGVLSEPGKMGYILRRFLRMFYRVAAALALSIFLLRRPFSLVGKSIILGMFIVR